MKKKLPYLVLLLLFLRTAHAQEHSYAHYDVHDGLAGATVYSMAQDKDGFIWFGTETGLSRFDGTHFVNFTTHDGLPDNEILKVFVDSRNRIWLIPFKNEVAYYYKGEFHTTKNDPVLRKISFDMEILSISEDSAGNIMLACITALYIIDQAGAITVVKTMKFQGETYVFQRCGLSKDHRFRVYTTRLGWILVCDIYGDKAIPVKWLPETKSKTTLVEFISPDLEIYEGSDSIIFFKPRDSNYFSIPIPSGIISISRINDSITILNTNTNAFMFNLRRKAITDSFLSGRTVNSSMEDSEGNIWFSTLGQGVYRLGSLATRNYYFKQQNYTLPVFCIKKFDSVLYFGSDHFFLSVLDLRTGACTSKAIYNATTRGRITCMVRLNGRLMVGTDRGMFELHDLDHPAIPRRLSESIKTVCVINDSTLLKISNLGAMEWSLRSYLNINVVIHQRATCGLYDNGRFYIGTLAGFSVWDKNGKSTVLGDQFKELSSRITGIEKATDGTFWLATEGDGLVGYQVNKPLIHVTEMNGLTSNICRSLFLSGKDVWVGTDKGLNKVSLADGSWKVTPYTMADGLNSDMINAIFVQGNEVYAGTSNGVTYFDENKVSRRSSCLLRLTDISVSGKKLVTDSFDFHLQHKNNNIKFDFVGISYKSAGNILYRYRLVGLDTAWLTTRETFLSYPSLPSGDYALDLIAINKFGLKSKEMRIPFSVDKLLWEKTWFRIVVLFFVVISVIFFFNYRVQRIRKKESDKSETVMKMAELEQMALRSQMNPHFIFNCLNSIQEYVLDRDVLGANEFITKFSNLIRQTLDISSRPFISIYEELIYISTYLELEKKRFGNRFIYEIGVDEAIDRHEAYIPPMILQPFVENAIRHGVGHRPDNNGKIQLLMKAGASRLICVIEDNGVGRLQAGKYRKNAIHYQSKGMSLVEKRIGMFNKAVAEPVTIDIEDLTDAAGTATGTRITINFPYET